MAEAAPESSDVPWSGVVKKTISSPLDKVWDVAFQFLGFPNLLTLEPVEGENRVSGCTRKVTDLPGRTDTDSNQWAKQKLVVINLSEHVFSYEFLENNTRLLLRIPGKAGGRWKDFGAVGFLIQPVPSWQ